MIGNPIWLVFFASLIAALPIAVGVLTSYVKISIVLGFLRSGLGAQQVPSALLVMAISLALTAYIMTPVVIQTLEIGKKFDDKIFERSPKLSDIESFLPLFEPWRSFMLKHAGKKELIVLNNLALDGSTSNNNFLADELPKSSDMLQDPTLRVLMPAFALTEIKQGFVMGFVLLLPFLVIDLIVANILAGMGMYMLSPVLISLPLKLILFVLADGWLLLTKGIIQSYL